MWKNVSIQNLLLCFPSINCKFNQQKTFFNLSTKLTVQGFLNARGRPIYFLNSSKGFKSPLLFIIISAWNESIDTEKYVEKIKSRVRFKEKLARVIMKTISSRFYWSRSLTYLLVEVESRNIKVSGLLPRMEQRVLQL